MQILMNETKTHAEMVDEIIEVLNNNFRATAELYTKVVTTPIYIMVNDDSLEHDEVAEFACLGNALTAIDRMGFNIVQEEYNKWQWYWESRSDSDTWSEMLYDTKREAVDAFLENHPEAYDLMRRIPDEVNKPASKSEK